ncbi:hypothetical protein K458DRAFT_391362 [Lentithecium fluviatile CBS 122367]|uniref:Jacalin-type lectin domain-containing protein n=1 Tax=Lentithecium fluviatile CBS 122367 TaxID=1168545 RepID=A0A6G1IUC4_9PLEO|nr:hypothetical protein K458DRAFT_391362 [Lentithecium fluviatile CBS 122367]
MSETAPSFDLDAQSKLGVTSLNAVTTKSEGVSGSKEFTLTNQQLAVTKIEVWTDTGSKTKDGDFHDRQLVKDIELTWNNGVTSNITGNQSGNSKDFDFNDKEKATSMTIRTGGRVDKISFNTDKEEDGKYLGKGILYGFHGHYDQTEKELISIGAKFKN